MQTDGRTGKTKRKVALRNFANAPKEKHKSEVHVHPTGKCLFTTYGFRLPLTPIFNSTRFSVLKFLHVWHSNDAADFHFPLSSHATLNTAVEMYDIFLTYMYSTRKSVTVCVCVCVLSEHVWILYIISHHSRFYALQHVAAVWSQMCGMKDTNNLIHCCNASVST
jgi:hypothetical protein